VSLSFFARPTLEVARDVIGTLLTVVVQSETVIGRIVETEAYLGTGDTASHAARGITRRNAVMFGPPGVAYVYFIYGMHHCLNFVTETEGIAGAVLIRAIEPVVGRETMARRRGRNRRRELGNGPAKLCRACGIDGSWNGRSLVKGAPVGDRLWLGRDGSPAPRVGAGSRIGIRKAVELPYRFVDLDSDCLSAPSVPRQPQ